MNWGEWYKGLKSNNNPNFGKANEKLIATAQALPDSFSYFIRFSDLGKKREIIFFKGLKEKKIIKMTLENTKFFFISFYVFMFFDFIFFYIKLAQINEEMKNNIKKMKENIDNAKSLKLIIEDVSDILANIKINDIKNKTNLIKLFENEKEILNQFSSNFETLSEICANYKRFESNEIDLKEFQLIYKKKFSLINQMITWDEFSKTFFFCIEKEGNLKKTLNELDINKLILYIILFSLFSDWIKKMYLVELKNGWKMII